jgi:hypothetical protein
MFRKYFSKSKNIFFLFAVRILKIEDLFLKLRGRLFQKFFVKKKDERAKFFFLKIFFKKYSTRKFFFLGIIKNKNSKKIFFLENFFKKKDERAKFFFLK